MVAPGNYALWAGNGGAIQWCHCSRGGATVRGKLGQVVQKEVGPQTHRSDVSQAQAGL